MTTVPPSMKVPTFQEMPLPNDPAKIFDSFDKRIHALEQLVTGRITGRISYVEEGNFPGGIIDVGGTPIALIPPDDVENVTATPGTFYENIYCDVEWDEATGGQDAVSFDVDLAEKTAGPTYTILNVYNTGGTNIRINNLEPNKDYGVRVVPVNNIGIRAAPPAWVDFTTGSDSTIPPAPAGLIIGSGATTVIVKFTGLTEVQAPDVAWGHGNYEIEIDIVNTFDSPFFRSAISSATVVAFNDIPAVLDPNPPYLPDPSVQPSWYARVRDIDSSGNASAWSATAGPSGPIGGVDGSMMLANLDAANITFGTMSGDRITVNTLDAGRIKTSSITAADITLAGGSFRAGNPPTTGVLINSQGIRLYQSGVAKIILDAATGSGTFNGNLGVTNMVGGEITGGTITAAAFRTNTPGNERLLIAGTPAGRIDYYSGSTGEADNGFLYFAVFGGTAPGRYLEVRLQPPSFTGIEEAPRLRLTAQSFDGLTKYDQAVIDIPTGLDYYVLEDTVGHTFQTQYDFNVNAAALWLYANATGGRINLDADQAVSVNDGPLIRSVLRYGVEGQYLPIGGVSGMMSGSAMSGGLDTDSSQAYIQTGSTVVTTDSGGYAYIAFPEVFAHGVMTVVAVNADFGSAPFGFVAVQNAGNDDFQVEATQHDGSGFVSQLIRVNWIAVGH